MSFEQQTILKQWNDMGFIPFRLEVLTPVFVSSGDVISPLDYVLGQRQDESLYRIDLNAWIAKGASKEEIDALGCGDLRRIRKMLQDSVDPARFSVSRTAISPLLRDELLAHIGDRQSNSTNDIGAALHNPLTGDPYLPGSSIKGALSTPLINYADVWAKTTRSVPTLKASCAGAFDRRQQASASREWMEKMFGRIGEHAMKALKISDCPASNDDMRIVRSIETGLKPDKQGTPKPPSETFSPGSVMYGRMFMAVQGRKPKIVIPGMGGAGDITFDKLCRICNDFYLSRYHAEKDRFYTRPHFRKTADALKQVDRQLELLNDPCPPLLLRIGHYSHVECVTVTDNAPERRRGKNGLMPTGTTRTLADGVLPFGWVLLHLCSTEEYEEHALAGEAESHCEWERSVFSAMQAERQELFLRQEQTKKDAERQAEQERIQVAAQQKAAMLEALPEDERLVFRLKDGDMTENEVMDIYSRLSEWNGDTQRQIAEAIRDNWQKSGKWSGKQSKKQAVKVEKLKSILG